MTQSNLAPIAPAHSRAARAQRFCLLCWKHPVDFDTVCEGLGSPRLIAKFFATITLGDSPSGRCPKLLLSSPVMATSRTHGICGNTFCCPRLSTPGEIVADQTDIFPWAAPRAPRRGRVARLNSVSVVSIPLDDQNLEPTRLLQIIAVAGVKKYTGCKGASFPGPVAPRGQAGGGPRLFLKAAKKFISTLRRLVLQARQGIELTSPLSIAQILAAGVCRQHCLGLLQCL